VGLPEKKKIKSQKGKNKGNLGLLRETDATDTYIYGEGDKQNV
jgi:hypothetical protein